MGKVVSALTGDLVRSSRLDSKSLSKTRGTVQVAVKEIASWHRGLVPAGVEFFRSDAWQTVIAQPRFGLRAAMFIRASLVAEGLADTRVAIGVGQVQRLERTRVSLSTGEALTLSGRALDTMGPAFRMITVAPAAAEPVAHWLPVVSYLADSLIRLWTRRQASIVREFLRIPSRTQDAVADDFAVTRQSVSKSLGGAEWRSLREALDVFERTDWKTLLASDSHSPNP